MKQENKSHTFNTYMCSVPSLCFAESLSHVRTRLVFTASMCASVYMLPLLLLLLLLLVLLRLLLLNIIWQKSVQRWYTFIWFFYAHSFDSLSRALLSSLPFVCELHSALWIEWQQQQICIVNALYSFICGDLSFSYLLRANRNKSHWFWLMGPLSMKPNPLTMKKIQLNSWMKMQRSKSIW